VIRAVFCEDTNCVEELDRFLKSLPPNRSYNYYSVVEQVGKFKYGLPVEMVQLEELAILTALVLMQPTCEGLEQAEVVDDLFGRLTTCLHTQMCLRTRKTGEGNESSNAKFFAILVRKLTELFR